MVGEGEKEKIEYIKEEYGTVQKEGRVSLREGKQKLHFSPSSSSSSSFPSKVSNIEIALVSIGLCLSSSSSVFFPSPILSTQTIQFWKKVAVKWEANFRFPPSFLFSEPRGLLAF